MQSEFFSVVEPGVAVVGEVLGVVDVALSVRALAVGAVGREVSELVGVGIVNVENSGESKALEEGVTCFPRHKSPCHTALVAIDFILVNEVHVVKCLYVGVIRTVFVVYWY